MSFNCLDQTGASQGIMRSASFSSLGKEGRAGRCWRRVRCRGCSRGAMRPHAMKLGLLGLLAALVVVFWLCFLLDPSTSSLRKPSELLSPGAEEETRLRGAPIAHLREFHPRHGVSSTSDKYVVYFEDGSVAFAKPVQEDNVVHFYLPLMRRTPLQLPLLSHLPYDVAHLRSRAGLPVEPIELPLLVNGRPLHRPHSCIRLSRWQYQGGPELLSHALDVALGWNRTALAVGREVPHRQVREGYTPFAFLRYAVAHVLPDYPVPMMLMPWHPRLHATPPSSMDAHYLALRVAVPRLRWAHKWLLHLSDMVVFGFLADDHDRVVQKNWMAAFEPRDSAEVFQFFNSIGRKHDADLFYRYASLSDENDRQLAASWRYLIWDSGLAFDHGPYTTPHACTDILCGPSPWYRADRKDLRDPSLPCPRVCLFRRETLALLTELSEVVSIDVEGTFLTTTLLSKRLLQAAETDSLSPLFHQLAYRLESPLGTTRLVRFDTASFLNSLDARLFILINHIEECVGVYGPTAALISEDDVS